MAGSGRFKGQEALKNQAMIVVRNITQQEVTNVIFPNGITVGAVDGPFKNGMRIHGNAQVSGIINAQGFKVNGEDLTAAGNPFLIVDVDQPAVSFENDADRSPSPTTVGITITQNNQTSTLQASDITATANDGTNLTVSSFSVTASSTGTSVATATVQMPDNPSSDYPVTITVSNDGLTSTKKVIRAVDGEDGTAGTPGVAYTIHLSNPAHTLFTTSAGTVNYSGSGTSISVFKNGVELNGITSGTPSTGEFSVTGVSATGITAGSRSSSGNPIICADGNSMTQNTASIVYTLSLENSVSVTTTQSLTKSISGADAQPFLSLDVNTTTCAFADSTDTSPSPASIDLTVIQSGQADTVVGSDIIAQNSNADEIVVASFSSSETSTGNSVATATIAAPSSPSLYPVTVTVSNDGLTSTKTISSVVGGDAGQTPATLFLDINTSTVSYDNSSDGTPNPPSVEMTIVQTGQNTTIQSSDIVVEKPDGSQITVNGFSNTESSTGNSVTTANITPPSAQGDYPVTITVSNDGLSSVKKVSAVIGGDDGASASGAVVSARGSGVNNFDGGGNSDFTNSNFNITDLSTTLVNVGSFYDAPQDIITSSNTIDSGNGDGTKDSIKLPAGTHKVELDITLGFGDSNSSYAPSRSIGSIGGTLRIVNSNTVDLATHGSTARDYGTASDGVTFTAEYFASGGTSPTTGSTVNLKTSQIITNANPVFVWGRVDYSRTGRFLNSGNTDVAIPSISIVATPMITVTKIA